MYKDWGDSLTRDRDHLETTPRTTLEHGCQQADGRIGDRNLAVNERRIQGICKSVARCFPKFNERHFDGVERWAGLRPCAPDGLPYIGPAGPGAGNVLMATGHAMMGLSLAPVTGYLMARILGGDLPDIDIAKLTPARF